MTEDARDEPPAADSGSPDGNGDERGVPPDDRSDDTGHDGEDAAERRDSATTDPQADDAAGESGVDDGGRPESEAAGSGVEPSGVGGSETPDSDAAGPEADPSGAVASETVDSNGTPPATATPDRFVDRLASGFGFPSSRVAQAVLGLVVLALVGRLFLLGQRTAHWDEGRVAFWALRYSETGFFEYRPVVHGPFLFQVNSYLFSLFGASDTVARLPVALLGGVLPGAAWLFREHLRDSETVALAGLLAINPLLVYYSRFMRNSVLVAGFMLFALGFIVRAYDSRNGWYAVPAGLCLALGFASKENALVYLVCWFGAAALLLDHRLIGSVRDSAATITGSADRRPTLTRDRIRDGLSRLEPSRALATAVFVGLNPLVAFFLVDAMPTILISPAFLVGITALFGYLFALRGANPWHFAGFLAFLVFAFDVSSGLTHLQTMFGYTLFWLLAAALVVDERLFTPPDTDGERSILASFPPMLAAYVVTFATLVFFYAPRSPDPTALGFWNAMVDPAMIPDMVEEALLGSAEELWGYWVNSNPEEQLKQYPGFLARMKDTLLTGAGLVSVFAVVGFFYDRWTGDGPRDLVALAGYWGFVSILGYPYATDIWGGWIAVNVVVPLAIPAAVTVAAIYRVGRDAAARDDQLSAALVGVVLLVAISPAAVTAVDLAYLNSDGTDRVLDDIVGGGADGERKVIQYAQPGNGLKETLGTVESVVRSHDGTDVLFYGTTPPSSDTVELYVPDEQVCLQRPPVHEPADTCNVPELSWHSRLPLPWYLESYGATVESTLPNADLTEREDIPPVVISRDWERSNLASMLPSDYEVHVDRFRMPDGDDVVIFVDTSEIPGN